MALPTLQDLKDYCKVETTVEDAMLARLLDQALGLAQGRLSCPIVARAETFTVRCRGHVLARAIAAPAAPLALSPAPVVADRWGVVVDPAKYSVDQRTGIFERLDWCYWDRGPYAIAVTWGLSVLPEYGIEVEPAIGGAIVDIAAFLYQNRNPAARGESAGGGVSTQVDPAVLEARVAGALGPLLIYERVPQ